MKVILRGKFSFPLFLCCFGRFFTIAEIWPGRNSVKISKTEVKESKADLLSWGQMGATARSQRSCSISSSGGGTESAKEQDYSLPEARENHHRLTLCVGRAGSTWVHCRRWPGDQKRKGPPVLHVALGLWRAAPPCTSLNSALEKKQQRQNEGFLRSSVFSLNKGTTLLKGTI